MVVAARSAGLGIVRALNTVVTLGANLTIVVGFRSRLVSVGATVAHVTRGARQAGISFDADDGVSANGAHSAQILATVLNGWARVNVVTVLAEDLGFSASRANVSVVASDRVISTARAVAVDGALNLLVSSVFVTVEATTASLHGG